MNINGRRTMKSYTYKDILLAKSMLKKLEKMPVGTEVSITELGYKVLKPSERDRDWLPVMDAFDKVLADDGRFRLDITKHQFLHEGLPYDIPQTLLRKGQSIHAKESKIAKSFAEKEGIQRIQFLCYLPDIWAFSIKNDTEREVESSASHAYIVVDEKCNPRWATKEEAKEIYDIERWSSKNV